MQIIGKVLYKKHIIILKKKEEIKEPLIGGLSELNKIFAE